MNKNTYLSYAKKPKIIVPVVIVVLVALYVAFGGGNGSDVETATVERGTLSQTVAASGKTKALSEAALGFDRTGRVARVAVKEGDTVKPGDMLVELDRDQTYAQYLKAQASLAETRTGTRSLELTIAENSLADAQAVMRAALFSVTSDINDALSNYIDGFYEYPRQSNPDFILPISSETKDKKLGNDRLLVEESLDAWQAEITSASPENIGTAITKGRGYLALIRTFVDDVTSAVNGLTTSSGLTESEIAEYKSDAGSAQSLVSTAIANFVSAAEKLSAAENDLALKRAGSREEAVAAAEAEVSAIGAELRSMAITAPIAGIVTKLDVEQGEIVQAGSTVVTVISTGGFFIEANVPEIGIGRVEVGNHVDVTLDAFPGEAFRGTVSYIEASETQVDGVANFKVNIAFTEVPEHMKSGLSTNLQIVTLRKDDVLLVPFHFLSFEGAQAYAYKAEGEKGEKTPVTLGPRGEDGRSEVLSGLSEGDVLVTPPAKK